MSPTDVRVYVALLRLKLNFPPSSCRLQGTPMSSTHMSVYASIYMLDLTNLSSLRVDEPSCRSSTCLGSSNMDPWRLLLHAIVGHGNTLDVVWMERSFRTACCNKVV